MRETDIWKSASDAEFENAMEGREKLVMNRVYVVYGAPAPSAILSSYTLFQHIYTPDSTFEPSTTDND